MRVKRHIEDTVGATSSSQVRYMRFCIHTLSLTRNQNPQDPNEVSEYWRAGQLRTGLSNLSNAISCFPPRQVANFLVQTFFRYAQTTYFYIEERWLLEKLDNLYNDPSNLTTKHAATVSIILTVFAVGTQYAQLDSPDRNARSSTNPISSEDEIGTMFYQHAIRLLPEIIESSSLESVQACLLFGVYALPIDASGLGFIYLNLAIRLGIQNGMHRKVTNPAFSAAMKETRKRVWWSVFALDR